MQSRHIDDGTSIYSFMHMFLVRCPNCNLCAQVARVGEASIQSTGKLTCTHCGCAKTCPLTGWSDREARDWYFKLPLWLQKPCCGHVLWAFNLEHLSFIESYISAKHRERNFDASEDPYQIRNKTLASRLPKWMTSAKHREEILRTIDQLRQKGVT